MTPTVVPDRIGVEEGWRIWLVWEESDSLHSPQLQTVWTPREEALAACAAASWRPAPPAAVHEDETAPAVGCRCGIYAMRRAADVVPAPGYRPQWMGGRACHLVLGRVRLWGKVIPAIRGWRAQFAYPAGLIAFESSEAPHWYAPQEAVERIARLYGVGVAVFAPSTRVRDP